MRPYFTVIVDSFREALASWVLWILLAVMTLGLLALSPIGLTEQRALIFRRNTVRNWPSLVEEIKQQSQAESPSPGKRIWELSSRRFRETVEAATEVEGAPEVDRRTMSVMVEEFNKLLPKRNFYDKASWQEVALSQEAAELLDRGVDDLSSEDLVLLNRLLLRSAYRDQIMNVPQAEVYISYLVFSSDEPLPVSREMLEPFIQQFLTVIMNYIVGLIAIFVAILVTASIIPRTFEAGAVDLLLSKPVSRSMLFLSKFVGGCAFILLNATYAIIGIWLIVGFRLGIWNHRLLLCIPVLLFLFTIYYSVSALAGVIWKNAIVAIVITILFRLALFGVGTTKEFIETSLLDPYRIVDVVSTGDTLVAVNQRGQFVEWDPGKREWVAVIESDVPRSPFQRPPITAGLTYDRQREQLIYLTCIRPDDGGFGFARPSASFQTASWSGGWRRQTGPTPPNSASWMFLEDDGQITVVAADGVYRLTAQDRDGERPQLLGVELPFGGSTFKHAGPLPVVQMPLPFAASHDAKTGNIAVYSDQKLTMLRRGGDGAYTREATRTFEDAEGPALLAFAGKTIMIAFSDGRLLALDAKDLKTRRSFHPESSEPYRAAASPGGRWFAVLFHNGSLWQFDAEENELTSLDSDATAVAFEGDDHLLVADQAARVLRYQFGSLEVTDRYQADLTLTVGIHRYALVPIYTIFPKPGELSNVVQYLLTGSKTVAPEKADPRINRPTLDVYGPIWSSLAFVVVMLALTCIYLQRIDI